MPAAAPTSLIDLVLPLAAFSFVMSITPGPNNFMLLVAGARFGLLSCVPHMLGITGGFVLLLALAYAGVAALALSYPQVITFLTLGCAGYLLWLALGLARSSPPSDGGAQSGSALAQRPMTSTEALLFQFVNPKGWAMAIAAVGLVSQPAVDRGAAFAVLIAVCALVNLPCVLVWASFGAALRRVLQRGAVYRIYSFCMAAALVATAAWMLRPLIAPWSPAN